MGSYVGLQNWPRIEVNFDEWGSPQEVVANVKGERTNLLEGVGIIEVQAYIKAGDLPKTMIVFDALPVLNYTETQE